ncbi:MAG: AAA family ATPase [candidate division Zixibacteria bacterium]|nr:AAA family ATPase [candidate division Zixibacteria bacterium]
MRIESFRIRNYRSIKDSGTCFVAGDNVTVLAGKNESGKTAILEALEDFNAGKDIRDDAIPLFDRNARPEITIKFEIDKRAVKKTFTAMSLDSPSTDDRHIELVKQHPSRYSLSEDSKKLLKISGLHVSDVLKDKQKKLRELHKKIRRIHSESENLGGLLPEIAFGNLSKLKTLLRNFVKATKPSLALITDEQDRSTFSDSLREAISVISGMQNLRSVESRLIKKMKSRIPNFILFSSFDDILPSEISFFEAEKNDLIRDLAIVSDLDLELIKSGSSTDKAKHKDQLNITVKADYQRFWTQDLANLHIDWDSNKLNFFVKEGDDFFPPHMRSKGKQWHLAFYTRVSARSKEDELNVILIDEPGLFLHAKAQKDVLKKLSESAKDTPIIFSTHSPYLIDVDKLSRVRLVTREEESPEGTIISNKIHKNADKETLTPIITAIGLDLSMGLDIAKDNNIIVEGPTDYYYLCAFKELLRFKFRKEVHLIPAIGANNASFLVPLMIGWGLNFCVVLDNDEKGRSVEKKLSKHFGHTNLKIIFISEKKDEEIEDLFERQDFITHVLRKKPKERETNERNSQIIKHKGKQYDRVLLSKLFFENVNAGAASISDTTKRNFKAVFERIERSMFP